MLLRVLILMDRSYPHLNRSSCQMVVLHDLPEDSERVVIGITRAGFGYQSQDIKIRVEVVAGAVLVAETVSLGLSLKQIQMKQSDWNVLGDKLTGSSK